MTQPVEAMVMPWGPFARQCADTRVSHTTIRWRIGETEVSRLYETCIGFSVMPSGSDAVQIAASVGSADQPSSPVILRILRDASGAARPAAPGDTGLLAQGSDRPDAAKTLAADIGLTARQMIHPNETLALPIHLSVPFPLDGVLSCHPAGESNDRGRETVVLSCSLDEAVRSDRLDAHVQLNGVEEIDLLTGVRLTSALSGQLVGRQRSQDDGSWQSAKEQLRYWRDTEFQ